MRGTDLTVTRTEALLVVENAFSCNGFPYPAKSKRGTAGRGRDRKCPKLSQIVVTFYDEFYDDL